MDDKCYCGATFLQSTQKILMQAFMAQLFSPHWRSCSSHLPDSKNTSNGGHIPKTMCVNCDPLSENLALRANIEFEIEAILSVQVVSWLNSDYCTNVSQGSLVPRSRPAFRRLQCRKAWRAWYLFSREHDVIGKWRKVSEQTGCVSRISQLTTRSTLGVYDNRPPIARYVW